MQPTSRRVGALAAVLVVGAASLSAPLTRAAAASGPPHGGTLDIALSGLLPNISPAVANVGEEEPSYAMGLVYGFLGYENRTTGAVELQFLKSITPSDDYKVWTLTLHPGLKFSDGTDLNAAAIAYTIAQQANPKNGYMDQSEVAPYKTKVVNDLTLQIRLPKTDAGFPAEMTQYFASIGSPTAWKKEGVKFGTHPVGAGPFELQSWVQNVSMTFVPNPYYKNFAPGQPYLDKIVINNVDTQSQIMSAIESGSDQMTYLQGNQQFGQARSAGQKLVVTASSGGENLAFNTKTAPFDDLRAREAVSLALNHQELASIWSPGSAAAKNLFAPTSPYYDAKYNFPAQDKKKATQLFQALAKAGHPVHFTIMDDNAYPQIASYVQSHLDGYPGVQVKTDLVDPQIYIADSHTANFQMAPEGVSYNNPWPTLEQQNVPGGEDNISLWNDPKVTAAFDTIRQTTNQAVLKKQYAIVEREVQTQYPFFFSQGSSLGEAYSPKLGGVQVIGYGVTPLLAGVYFK